MIADIDLDAAEKTVSEVAAKHNVKVMAFKADVSKHSEVKQLRKDIEASFGFVDLLVNNVGLLALDISLREKSTERIQQIVDVNLMSHFWVSFKIIFCQ